MGFNWQQLNPLNLLTAPAPSSAQQPAVVPPQGCAPVYLLNLGGCCCSCRCHKHCKRVPPPKGKLKVRAIEELGAMSLKFQIDLNSAPSTAPDVAKRHLFLTVADGAQNEIVKGVGAGENLVEFVCERGDPVACYLRDEDGDGNLSEPGELNSFIAKDTIAPGAPGKLAVNLVDDNFTAPTTTPDPGTP